MPEATVSSKGWIVIPSEMRKKYDLQPGSKVSVVDYGGILSIVPHRGDAVETTYGMMAYKGSMTADVVREPQDEAARDEQKLKRRGTR
jgi:AbrB family looped-hinge helix DNA binding protein